MVFKLDCLCVYLVAQLCPTLCDPMGYRQQAFVPGILQASILELVVIPFSRGSSQAGNQIPTSCTSGYTLRPEPRESPYLG